MVRDRFGDSMDHDLELVEKIPQERSGKYRFSICRIPESERKQAVPSTSR
jgi:hypothetical protein